MLKNYKILKAAEGYIAFCLDREIEDCPHFMVGYNLAKGEKNPDYCDTRYLTLDENGDVRLSK